MSFRLASVSNVELWNFRDSPPSLQDFIDELHEIPIAVAIILLVEFGVLLRRELLGVRDDRLFSQYSAIIICLCSSSKVLICAFELFRSLSFPDRSTILSVWMSSEKLLWALNVFRVTLHLYVFLETPKPIGWSTFLSPSDWTDPSNVTDDDDWLTDWHAFWIATIGLSSVCLLSAASQMSRHPCPGPKTE